MNIKLPNLSLVVLIGPSGSGKSTFPRPVTVVLTAPNREYNMRWENVGVERLRHPDQRFEWTRPEFREWAEGVAGRYGYGVRFLPVGPEDQVLGAPKQMAGIARNPSSL